MTSIDNQIRTTVSFLLAVAIMTTLLVVQLPWNEASYFVQKVGNIERAIWYGIGVATAIWYWKRAEKFEFFTTLFIVFFGPLIPLMLFIYWLSLKVVPR